MVKRIELIPVEGVPEVRSGDELGGMIVAALASSGESLIDGDVLVVTHKVISKAEGRIAEVGSHDELMQLGRIYAGLYTIQQQALNG